MTRKEYLKQKRANKKAFARFMRFNAQVIRADYVKAVQGFKKIVSRLPSVPLSDKNKARLVDSIPRQTLFDGIKDIIRESGLAAMEKDSDIDIEYLAEAFETAGVEIGKEEIKQVFGKQHTKLIERFQVKNAFRTFAPVKPSGISLLANRAAYDLSSSIWEGIDSFTDKLIAYVQGSINQGIDPVIISREIEQYLREGSEFVFGRWGKLEPGTADYVKRLGKAGADYRTQRVVRTELYQMIRDNSIATGTLNPACTQKFNWILSPAHIDWGCECPDIAAGGPYTEAEIQAYSDSIHPNCHTGETEIETLEGTKQIKDIIPGDRIVSHDGTVREVSHVWKQWYDGDMLTVQTNNGSVNVTPNHPLLTESGWVESRFLKEEDNIVSIGIDRESALFVENKSVNAPPDRNKEVGFFIICDFLSRAGVPVSAIYFDGNLYIRKSKIDVIPFNGISGESLYTASEQGVIQHALVSAPELSGVELCYGGSVFVRLDCSTDGIMCGIGNGNPSVGIRSSMTLGDCRRLESMSDKVSGDAMPSNPEYLGYLVNRKVLVNKQVVDRVIGKVVCSTHNNPIVSVSSAKYKGYVYNLTVQGTHTYIANGIGSHNCLCTVEPELKDDEAFMQQLEDYVNEEDTAGAHEIETWAVKYGLTA